MKKVSPLFKVIKKAVDIFYPNTELIGTEHLPDEPAIIVGNHAQMNGPIIGELYMPDNYYIWCAAQMMHLKDVPAYAFSDFWSEKPIYSRWFFKVLSYIIAPLSVLVFNNARTIPVYKDTRILTTFRATLEKLQQGNSIIIFPEQDKNFNNILYDFQDKFVDIARLYHNKTGKELKFVPMYIAPSLKKVYFGKSVSFSGKADIIDERARIRTSLMTTITEIATSLPVHTVVPYKNVPKKLYPKNKTEDKKN